MKKSKILVACTVLMLVVFLVVTGCGGPAPAGNGDAPAASQEVIDWTIATSWPAGMLLHEMAEIWADKVEKASGGRMRIEVLPGGAMVGPLEVLDAASAGTIDGMHSWSAYWIGKHPGAHMFSSIPMLFDTHSHIAWMIDRGLDYQNQLYQDKMGLNTVTFLCGATHPELLAHSNVPLAKLDDWQGTKYRTPGWWAEILKDMGVAVVTIPGAEVYPSLERGVIDAAEFSSPVVNYDLGFHEVTSFYTGPGMHQPSVLFEITLNKSSFDALPADLQEIVEQAALATTIETWAYDIVEGIRILDQWEGAGLTPVKVDDDAQVAFREQAWDFIEKEAQKDPFLKEMWDDAREFYVQFNQYEDFMNPVRDIPAAWQ